MALIIKNMKKENVKLTGGVELPLHAKKKGAAGAAPPQKTKEYFKAYFTSHFGFADEWNTGGNLPHRNSKKLIQSITFRLADSLPQSILRNIEDELKDTPTTKREIKKREEVERWLHKGLGSCALANPKMAQVMWNAFKYYNGDRYNLIAWSIMPNHVHVLIDTKHDLSKIVQGWKSYTGRWAFANNKKYGLKIEDDAKRFWRSEYWDRFIRDENHFENVVNYIMENPNKAKLNKDSTAYQFTGNIFSDSVRDEKICDDLRES